MDTTGGLPRRRAGGDGGLGGRAVIPRRRRPVDGVGIDAERLGEGAGGGDAGALEALLDCGHRRAGDMGLIRQFLLGEVAM